MKEVNKSRVVKLVNDFVGFYPRYISDPLKRRELIVDFLPYILRLMENYYDNKWSEHRPLMNKILEITQTRKFALDLQTILTDEVYDDYAEDWNLFAQLISLTIAICNEEMKEETIVVYTLEILKRMWETEIKELVKEYGVTEKLALDLFMTIPKLPKDMQNHDLNRLTKAFLDRMILHAETNIDVLDGETQAGLMKFMFSEKDNEESNLYVKVLGRFLNLPYKEPQGKWQIAVYQEFVLMLYNELDNLESRDIEFVIKFIVNYRKKLQIDSKGQIFSAVTANRYQHIRTAIRKIIGNDRSAMAVL